MNRPSPSCPPALLPMFRPPSTPSLLASRDCESHTYIRISQSSPRQTACLWWLTAREFRDAITHTAEVLFSPVFSWKAFFSSAFFFSFFFLDPSARLPSPQDVTTVGDEAVSVCCAASVKPVFSLIQPNSNFSTLYTPTPQSTCLLQLGSHHAEPCTSLMVAFSHSALAALDFGCKILQDSKIVTKKMKTFWNLVLLLDIWIHESLS